MMTEPILTLIVARPGPVRDGLRALLTAIPQVTNLQEIDDASSALRIVKEHCPALVLISVDLPSGEFWSLLAQIKAQHPQTRSILLVNDVQQQELAQTAGADGVLLQGAPASKLSATIKHLLHV
ncbi:MAG: response regulator transcription factor [Chloroflexi bacterium]|nr:response regulator transcription factor [Chloroflexota bacterium]